MTGDGDRTSLRLQMRERRRALPAAERERAALAACHHLLSLGLPRPGSRIAAYLPVAGELDPGPILDWARRRGCRIHVPVITPGQRSRMRFASLRGPLRANRFGIPEPDASACVDGRWLDLVLLPCVAFDEHGARLGMGAGFYDRHFAFLRHRQAWRRPRLIGLGYAFQRVAPLAPRSWDVPLWGVVTDAGFIRCRPT